MASPVVISSWSSSPRRALGISISPKSLMTPATMPKWSKLSTVTMSTLAPPLHGSDSSRYAREDKLFLRYVHLLNVGYRAPTSRNMHSKALTLVSTGPFHCDIDTVLQKAAVAF